MGIFNKIVKQAKRALLYTALATKKVEDQQISQLGSSEGNVVRKYERNTFVNDLLNGRNTQRAQEYKKFFYKQLEALDKVANTTKYSIGGDINMEMKDDKNDSGSFEIKSSRITEDEFITRRNTELEKKRDKSDDYPIDYVEEYSRVIINNFAMAEKNADPKYETNIRFFIGEDEVLINDDLINGIHVKTINDDNKMIDLIFTYTEMYEELFTDVKNDPSIIFSFDSLIVKRGKYAEVLNHYVVEEFDKIIQPYKGKTVFKFRAKLTPLK
jgi:hypothetical protein